MAQIPPSRPRRKALRYGVPVAIAGVAAATVGLVPALADAGDPDLPKITAQELVAKMAKSDVEQFSGTVKIDADLGLPSLPGSGSTGGQGGPFGGGEGGGGEEGKDGKGEKPSAAPQKKLTQLASGEHMLRVAADGPDKQRVSVVEDAAEYSMIHNAGELWAYDSASNAAWHAKAPKGGKAETKHEKMPELTPDKAAKEALKAAEKSGTDASVDGTAKVAGRDAYQLVLTPKDAPDTTVGEIRVAVDADNGAPLKFTLSPKGGGSPVVDVGYTKVDFGKPDGGTFDFTPPKGTKVTEQKSDKKLDKKFGEKADGAAPQGKPGLSGLDILGEGATWNKVAKIDGGALAGSLGKENGPKAGPGKDQFGGKGGDAARAGKLLDSLTEEAKGEFGTGHVFKTRLINALITDDGTVYVGAVTKDGLVKAANADAK